MLKLGNNAYGLLGSNLTTSGTTLTLTTGQGARFPSLTAGEWFPVTLVQASNPANLEIVRVTARSGDSLTIVRAQENTSAKAFAAGDFVESRLTVGALQRVTVSDETPHVQNQADPTKRLRFSVASVGAGQTRTLTMPNRDVTLGTAAEANVTTSNTDATAGRVSRVGDWGVGAQYPVVSLLDWNNLPDLYPASGRLGFLASNDWSNAMPGSLYVHPEQIILNNGNVTQIGWPYRVDTDGFWMRSRFSGTWSPWRQIYHTGNLSPVETSRTITAGNGLTGGGNLSADRTLTLGTPGTLNSGTGNGVTAGSHTHSLNIDGFFTGTNHSVASNGFQRLPGGIIVQWGSLTASISGTVLSFPIAFPNACRQAVATHDTSSTLTQATGYDGKTAVNNLSATTMVVRADGLTRWFAIGY